MAVRAKSASFSPSKLDRIEAGGRLVEELLAPAHQHELCSVGGEALCDGQADARAATRHYGELSLELTHAPSQSSPGAGPAVVTNPGRKYSSSRRRR